MSRMVIAETTAVTINEWNVTHLGTLPEGYHYELANGVLYMTALAGWPRGLVMDNLADTLSPWVRSHGLGRVMPSRFGLYISKRDYLDPDLLFLSADQMPRRVGQLATTATLAVEFLSPSTTRMSQDKREALLSRAGVKELWRVDAKQRTLQARRQTEASYAPVAVFQNEDMVRSDVLPGLEFPLTALWEDLDA